MGFIKGKGFRTSSKGGGNRHVTYRYVFLLDKISKRRFCTYMSKQSAG